MLGADECGMEGVATTRLGQSFAWHPWGGGNAVSSGGGLLVLFVHVYGFCVHMKRMVAFRHQMQT
jgi:hypothetical protein